jgi:hypothetical protein
MPVIAQVNGIRHTICMALTSGGIRCVVLPLLGLVACDSPSRRAEQYTTCETAYRNAQRITECLIMKYNWDASAAGSAGTSYELYVTGWGRNPLYYIRGPKEPIAEEMKAILWDLSMSQAARIDRRLGYTSHVTDIPWVEHVDSAFSVRIVQARPWTGWSAVVESARYHLRCAIYDGVHPVAPATSE